jgi:hypothetical protein
MTRPAREAEGEVQSTRLRFAAFVAVSLVAVAWGFLFATPARAEVWLRTFGYGIMLGAFVGAAIAAWSLRRHVRAVLGDWLSGRAGSSALTWAVLAFAAWLVLCGEPRGFKVTNDEYVLQATAQHLHLEREPAALVRAHYINGAFTPLHGYVDKRPFAFAFLLSLLHDLTGYRVENAFVLNAGLGLLSLLVVLRLAERVSGHRNAALAAVLLWAGLPLFIQNASGSGFDLMNVVVLGLVVLLAWGYLERVESAWANALAFATVILAQTRYESVLFVPVAALVILAGWWRAQRIVLPAAVILSPLLLLPYAWQHQITSANPAMWELRPEQVERFGWGFLEANYASAIQFFFAWQNRMISNSWLLSATTVASFAFGLWWLAARREWPTRVRIHGVLLLYGAAVCANFALVMFYYWGQLTDPVASRLALPIMGMGAVTTAWLIGRLANLGLDARWAIAAGVLYTIGVVRPATANRYYSAFNLAAAQVVWEQDVVRHRPPANRLIVSNKTVLPWIIAEQPAIALASARQRGDQLRFHLAAGTFGEILVTQRLQPSTAEGDYEVDPADELPAEFTLQPVAEKRFAATLARVSRLVAVGESPAELGRE